LSCTAFLFCQSAYAGLIGETLDISYTAQLFTAPGVPSLPTGKSGALTVGATASSLFGVTVDDTTITIAPLSYIRVYVFDWVYTIRARDGLLPKFDWAALAATYPGFNLNEGLMESSNGFTVKVDPFLYSQLGLSVSLLSADSSKVPKPPMSGILAIGLIAFIRSRRHTKSNRRSHVPS
jgi:hypothetical protein